MADENRPIVKIDVAGDFGPAGDRLVKVVAATIGGAVEPYQIIRVAKATSRAAVIAAKTEIEIDELRHRALMRREREEIQHQRNIESITGLALPYLRSDAKPDQIDPDWISHFFEQCRNTSGQELQLLWARILAGEANSPVQLCRRTLNIVSTIGRDDAHQFEVLCRFTWRFSGGWDGSEPLVLNWHHPIFANTGLKFVGVMNLRSIGLIDYSANTNLIINIPRTSTASYFDRALRIETPDRPPTMPAHMDWSIPAGNVLFTRSGEELSIIPEVQPVPNYFDYVRDSWIYMASPTPGFRIQEV